MAERASSGPSWRPRHERVWPVPGESAPPRSRACVARAWRSQCRERRCWANGSHQLLEFAVDHHDTVHRPDQRHRTLGRHKDLAMS